MTAQEELQAIIADVKAWKWTPELFERIRRLLGYADVFNVLRRELTTEEHEQFDLEYCSYIRPQDREITKWLTEERRKAGERHWETMSRRDLRKLSDKKLLSLLRTLREENEL